MKEIYDENRIHNFNPTNKKRNRILNIIKRSCAEKKIRFIRIERKIVILTKDRF